MRLLPRTRPMRLMALAAFVNTAGNGLLLTIHLLYFTRIVGLSVAEAGLGLTIAGLFGLLAGVPLGHLADRRGPRNLLVLLCLLLTGPQILFLAVDEFWQFVVVSAVVVMLERGVQAVRNAMIAGLASDPAGRAAARSYLRAVTHVGISLGAGVGALALYWDSAAGYRALYLVNAATTVAMGLIVLAMPRIAPQPKPTDGPALLVLRDPGYLMFCLLTAGLSIHIWLLEVAIPLWVVGHTEAPRWLVGVLVAANTVVVALTQVPVSRRVTDPEAARRVTRYAGFLLLVATGLFAAASGGGVVVAVILLVAGVLVAVLAELLQVAGSFLLSYELAPEHAQGQYQGLWGSSLAVSGMVAPAVLVLLPLGLGVPGWLILGAWFALLGVLFVPVVGWADARRRVVDAET